MTLAEVVQLQRAEEQANSARLRFEMRITVGRSVIHRTVKVTPQPWVCIGCGQLRAPKRRKYCLVCRRRLAIGWALDVDDVPNMEDCERILRR